MPTLTPRENYIRALEFRHPQWIPVHVELEAAHWQKEGARLEEVVLRHPLVFPDYRKGDYLRARPGRFERAGEWLRDDWGCLWHSALPGILGRVVEHPLTDWAALAHLRPPDPRAQYDWPALRAAAERDRAAGRLTRASYDITKGGFFDRLQFLCGMESLLVDFLEEPPQLRTLMDMVLDYNMACIREWLAIGVDQFCFHGDIGTQRGPLFSPAVFRRQLLPYYREMFGACRRAGAHVWYSSDGNILSLIPDLIESGVTLHDPQVRANTVNGIARVYRGKLCALVDIDEQMLPFCTPAEIRAQVREVADRVGAPEGGLMYYLIPSSDVPLANVEALFSAYEEVRGR